MINLGYACINNELRDKNIYTNRSMIKRTFKSKGIKYASELALKNCEDLYKIIEWNVENKVSLFRMSSDLFPWSSEYQLSDLPDYDNIKLWLKRSGKLAITNKVRLTFHPGQFCVLASASSDVVSNAVVELNTHGRIMDIMGLSRSVYNKINIHVGGVYGNKEEALDRFCKNFDLLDDSVKTRLTVENDDKSSMYSVKDLYNGVYRKIGIPIVFDYYHHKFCDGSMTEKEALELAITTWPVDIVPCCHYSESRRIEYKDSTIKEQAHSDYCLMEIDNYGHRLDIVLEAKMKEKCLFNYKNLHS